MSKRFPTLENLIKSLVTQKPEQLDNQSADALFENRQELYETDEQYSPWTEWSEYCKQIGFEPHHSDSNDPVVRLLEPLYDQIKQLADEETKQAQSGETFSLDWMQVWINLHTRMSMEQLERQANQDEQMYFEMYTPQPRTYVWIGGRAYDFDSLLQALEELQSEGMSFNNCRVQPTYHRLLVEHQLANMDLSGFWHANVATLDMFIEQLYNTHERWQNNMKENE